MKKVILAPLCSALVIPGLGQVINQHLRKGLILLAVVFVLIIALTCSLYQIVSSVIRPGILNSHDPVKILEQIMAQDQTLLLVLLAAFVAVWLYSVIDAIVGGREADALDEEKGEVS